MKKHSILLGLIVCLLVIGIGISFSYFIGSVLITGTAAHTGGKTSDMLELTFDAGNDVLILNNAIPGDFATKNFEIKVRPTENEKEVTYAIKLIIENNSFEMCDDFNFTDDNECQKGASELIYTLKNNNNVIASGDLTTETGELILALETKNVDVETIFDYELEIEFVKTNASQNHNMNKELKGVIKVEFAE